MRKGYRFINAAIKEAIFHAVRNGMTRREASQIYDVTQSTINRICAGLPPDRTHSELQERNDPTPEEIAEQARLIKERNLELKRKEQWHPTLAPREFRFVAHEVRRESLKRGNY